MGRISDAIKSIFGLKAPDVSGLNTLPAENNNHHKNEDFPKTKLTDEEFSSLMEQIEKVESKPNIEGIPFYPPTSPENTVVIKIGKEPKDGDSGDGEERLAIKGPEEEPTDPRDCFQCKVVVVSTSSVLALYCLHIAKKNQDKYVGYKLYAFRSAGVLLATFFGTVALTRAFDWSIFSKEYQPMTPQEIQAKKQWVVNKLGIKYQIPNTEDNDNSG